MILGVRNIYKPLRTHTIELLPRQREDTGGRQACSEVSHPHPKNISSQKKMMILQYQSKTIFSSLDTSLQCLLVGNTPQNINSSKLIDSDLSSLSGFFCRAQYTNSSPDFQEFSMLLYYLKSKSAEPARGR